MQKQILLSFLNKSGPHPPSTSQPRYPEWGSSLIVIRHNNWQSFANASSSMEAGMVYLVLKSARHKRNLGYPEALTTSALWKSHFQMIASHSLMRQSVRKTDFPFFSNLHTRSKILAALVKRAEKQRKIWLKFSFFTVKSLLFPEKVNDPAWSNTPQGTQIVIDISCCSRVAHSRK